MAWQGSHQLPSRSYTCGWCGFSVASALGFHDGAGKPQYAYICPHCNRPSHFQDNRQLPGVASGAEVKNLPADIESLYREARNCAAASCFTASVLICRKLLMNIAVSHGAKSGETFVSYVEHLASAGYVPPNGKGWVDHIRQKGNEATHEIALMSATDADDLISFTEMLLKFVFEFPNRVPKAP
jgi:hypothetical protein